MTPERGIRRPLQPRRAKRLDIRPVPTLKAAGLWEKCPLVDRYSANAAVAFVPPELTVAVITSVFSYFNFASMMST